MTRSILLLLLARFAIAQSGTITEGPQITAAASIRKELEYTLQRSCVQHCLWYNGNNPRGYYYINWDDVGGELKCGPYPINACYCNTKYASSATSYFSTCIPYYCGSGDDADPADLVSALSLYNAYCATANGNPTKPVPEPVTVAATSTSAGSSSEAEASQASAPSSSPAQPTSAATSGATTSSSSSSANAQAKESPQQTATPEGENSGGGTSKGTTIGIAVGASLGGIVIIALGVLCFIFYRRRARNMEKQPMGGIEGY
ncbi:hypothetical protein TWF694_011505 [Orbilia ellipsospora]|uniref:Uncharacterized protein n=1 Tax=Orbilia ellipsospora TaxID=2528407 RepID=A0AAV9X6N9_9PEZI